jgi:hypothetical protein
MKVLLRIRRVQRLSLLLPIAVLLLLGAGAGAQIVLQPLTTFGTNGDGTIRPGDFDYAFLTSSNGLQRGLAYNPTTGHLIIVNRNPIGAETINIIDAFTGTNVSELDQSSRTFGGSADFAYDMVGVADDGAIYVGNLTTSGALVEFILYRWESETNLQTRVYGPANPGNTTSGNSRWGDTLAVRGSGINTEVLIASRGTLAAVLRPTDSSMATFSAATLTNTVTGALGFGLAFGPGNTFYSKFASAEGNPLYNFTYDALAGTATTNYVYQATTFPGRVGPIMVNPASNLLAAIEMTAATAPDRVRLYDVSNPANAPGLLDRQELAMWTNGNSIFAGALAFGSSNLYALNADNGIVAYTLTPGTATLPPLIFAQPPSKVVQITSNAVFTVGVDGSNPLAYQWLFNSNYIADATNSTLTLTNVATANGGYYAVIVTNNHGAVTSSVALLTVLPNYGNLLVYEPFAYPVGTILVGQGEWTMTSAAANGAMEAGNLIVPGLRESFGNRYTWTNNSSVRKPFGQYTSGEVFASFAFRLDTPSTTANNETTAGFSFGTSTTFPLKVNIIGDGAGGYNFGLYKGGGVTGNGLIDTSHTFNAGDTVFIVVRYAFDSSTLNGDNCSMWINPDVTTFGSNAPPAPTIANIGIGVSQASWTFIDRFFWRHSAPGYVKRTSDELRVGFSWAEVTPPAPPSLLIQPSGANVIISWPIYNSEGYSLQSNGRVDDSGGWETVGTQPVPQNGTNTVTVSASGTKFYRLIK